MERVAKEKFIKDLEEALKRAEERGFEAEERNARFAKMTPKERIKAIISEAFDSANDGFF